MIHAGKTWRINHKFNKCDCASQVSSYGIVLISSPSRVVEGVMSPRVLTSLIINDFPIPQVSRTLQEQAKEVAKVWLAD